MSRYQQGSEPIPSYKIVEFIGEGSYGSVYKARGPGGVDTALKFISLDNKQGLKEFKSVSLVKKLRHANLVPIFAIWLRDSNGNLMDESSGADSNSINLMGDKELVIAMGLGDISLAQALEESPKGIPPAKLIRYMEDAAKGIDYLNQPTHEPNNSSIIHCDIKPGNLLIVGGSVQVCDYGVAKALSNKVNLKKTMGAGTPAYAAPELINNDPSPQTDQYSLAISYVELRTGFLPFDETKALVSNLTGKLDFTKLPREEQEVMRRATSMQPGKRFESCMEMIEELKIASGLSRTGAVPVSATQRPVPGRPSTNFEFEPHRFIDDVLQKGEMLVPDHRLVRRIGEGGYGQVWEARDQDDAVCALKVVRRSGNRGQQEYEILKKVKQINHKHLLETQAIWLLAENTKLVPGNMVGKPGQPNVAAIVIKTKLADKNLLQHMQDCKQQGHESIPVPELLRYMHQAASAIDELNDQDIQHRDIKPENILLLRDDAYVSDFGLAKMIDDDSAQSSASGMTFDYAAPELLEEKRVTKWTDQYSLALTYIMLRTGKLPYPAQASQSQKMRARTSNDYDFSGLTPVEREILAQALDREPSHRFPSCVAMMTRLSRAMGLGSGPLTSASGNLRFKDPLAGGTAPPIPSTRNIGSSTKHKPLSSDLAVAQVEAKASGSEDRAPGNFRNKTIGFGNTDTGPMGPPNSEPSKSNVQWRSESPRAAGFTDLPPRRMPILSIIASFAVLVTLGIGAWALDLFSSNGSSSVASTSKTSAVTENPPVEVTRAERIEKLNVVQAALIARDDARQKTAIEAYFALNRPRPELEPALDRLVNAWTTFRNEPSLDTAESVIGWYDRMIPLENSLEPELKTPFHTAVHKRLSGILVALEPKLEDADWKRISELCEKAEPKVESLQKYAVLRILQMEAADDPKKKLDAADAAVVLIGTTANPKSIPESRRSTLERIIKDAEPALGPKDTERKDKYAAGIKQMYGEKKDIPPPDTERKVVVAQLVEIQKHLANGDAGKLSEAKDKYKTFKLPTEFVNALDNLESIWKEVNAKTAPDDIAKTDKWYKEILLFAPELSVLELRGPFQDFMKKRLNKYLVNVEKTLETCDWNLAYALCKEASPVPGTLLLECWTELPPNSEPYPRPAPKTEYEQNAYTKVMCDYRKAEELSDESAKNKEKLRVASQAAALKLDDYYTKRRASRVFKVLNEAAGLDTTSSSKYLALAAAWAPRAEIDTDPSKLARAIWNDIKNDPSKQPKKLDELFEYLKKKQLSLGELDKVKFWTAYGQTRASTESALILDSFKKAFDIASKSDECDPAVFRKYFLDPVNAIAVTVNSPLAKELAKLQFEIAMFVRTSADRWTADNKAEKPLLVSRDFLTSVVRMNDEDRRARAWLGIVRHELDDQLPVDEWAVLKTRNEESLEPAELLLTGICRSDEGKYDLDFAKRVESFAKAHDIFKRAVEKAGTDSEERRLACRIGAQNAIQLVSFERALSRKPELHKTILLLAHEWCSENAKKYPNDIASRDADGCVLEDLASFFKDKDHDLLAADATARQTPGYFAAAEFKFDEAVKPGTGSKKFRGEAFMHQGRCRFKWAEELHKLSKDVAEPVNRRNAARALAAEKLNDAIKSLKAAINSLQFEPASESSLLVRAESKHYLAKATILVSMLPEKPDATDLLQARNEAVDLQKECLKLSKGMKQTDWRRNAIMEICAIYMNRIFDPALKDNDERREICDKLEDFLKKNPDGTPSATVRGLYSAAVLYGRNQAGDKNNDEIRKLLEVATATTSLPQDRLVQAGLYHFLASYDPPAAERHYRRALEITEQFTNEKSVHAYYKARLGEFLFQIAKVDAVRPKTVNSEGVSLLLFALEHGRGDAAYRTWRKNLINHLNDVVTDNEGYEKVKTANMVGPFSKLVHERASAASLAIRLYAMELAEDRGLTDAAAKARSAENMSDLNGYRIAYEPYLTNALADTTVKPTEIETADWSLGLAELAVTLNDASTDQKKKLKTAENAWNSAESKSFDPILKSFMAAQHKRLSSADSAPKP